MTARKLRSEGALAYAVIRRGIIDLARIEPFTEEGRAELVRTLNRPAGEKVAVVSIRPHKQPR